MPAPPWPCPQRGIGLRRTRMVTRCHDRTVRHYGAVLVVVVGAVALALALGPGYAGYDASWALVWGGQIASGGLPAYETALAPTPHPLANLVAVPLSLLPDGGERGLVALSFLSFAALLAGAVVLGSRLAGPAAGVVAALVIGSRGLLDREVAFASHDIPFLALVIWAMAVTVARPRRGITALALLALAGLLRPEAWIMSLAYAAWLASGSPSPPRPRTVALAVAGPALWLLADLLVTGDPLHSFQSTRDLAATLGRPRGLDAALTGVPSSLAEILGLGVLLAGLAGLIAGLVTAPRRLLLPAAAGACSLATFFAIGVTQLPVLLRYLLVAACVLAVVAGVGTSAWTFAPGSRRRSASVVLAGAITLLLVASVPSTVSDVATARDFTRARGDVHGRLRDLTASPSFRAAATRCPKLLVPDFRSRPVVLLARVAAPEHVAVGNLADGERGLVLTYATGAAETIFNLGAPGEAGRQAAPARSRLVARNRHWVAYAAC